MRQCLRGKQRLEIISADGGPVGTLGFGSQSSLPSQQNKSRKSNKRSFQVCSR